MWPKRKPKNRRNERTGKLDVRARSRDARTGRLRAIVAAVGLVAIGALGALLIWSAYRLALQRFVYQNEAYTVRRIQIFHEGRLRPEHVQLWSGVAVGQNLFAVDLDQVRYRLEQNPWIARAEVDAHRPDTIRISVREREPVAQIVQWRHSEAEHRSWPETNYVDHAGFILPPLRADNLRPGATANFSHLTRLSGLDPYIVTSGHPLNHPRLPAALELIRAYEDSSLYAQVDLDEVSLAQPDVFVGRLRQGSEIIFGPAAFDRQLARWRSIQEYTVQTNHELAWLDLSVTNNIPARWVPLPVPGDPTNATPRRPFPAAPKPPRPSRRHV